MHKSCKMFTMKWLLIQMVSNLLDWRITSTMVLWHHRYLFTCYNSRNSSLPYFIFNGFFALTFSLTAQKLSWNSWSNSVDTDVARIHLWQLILVTCITSCSKNSSLDNTLQHDWLVSHSPVTVTWVNKSGVSGGPPDMAWPVWPPQIH